MEPDISRMQTTDETRSETIAAERQAERDFQAERRAAAEAKDPRPDYGPSELRPIETRYLNNDGIQKARALSTQLETLSKEIDAVHSIHNGPDFAAAKQKFYECAAGLKFAVENNPEYLLPKE